MAGPQQSQLVLLSETTLHARAAQGFPCDCPTMRVSAVWDAVEKELSLYRTSADISLKIRQKGAPGTDDPDLVALTWRPDGQFLALGWSDGMVRITGLETKKAAHQIPVRKGIGVTISHIGWTRCHIGEDVALQLALKLDHVSSDETPAEHDLSPNLPQELTFLDLDAALPKLSSFPPGSAGSGDDAVVFTDRAEIDSLFRPLEPDDYEHVHLMVVGTRDGHIQLNIWDSFLIGTFPSPMSDISASSYMIAHISHSQLSSQAVVFAEDQKNPDTIRLIPLDLPFVASCPISLSLLGNKLTTLQNLLRYVRQAQLHMQVEFNNTRELPRRFLRSLTEDLKKASTGPRDIVPALFHTVVTGHAYEPVREWLVDIVAERGRKRWDKAMVSGLENLRSLVHENFLPALERCAAIASRLRGLALFHEDRNDNGFSASQLSGILDVITCLSLVGHKVLTNTMDELAHFPSFSTWLSLQIDALASNNPEIFDNDDKDTSIDLGVVLTYIERYLVSSPLDVFFDKVSESEWQDDWESIKDCAELLPILDIQLNKHETAQASRTAVQQVAFLVEYLCGSSDNIFDGIAEAMKRSVRFGPPIMISVGQPIALMDAHMSYKTRNAGVMHAAISTKTEDSRVYLFRSELHVVNGYSISSPLLSVCVDLQDRRLIDIKFLDDETLVLLCDQAGTFLTIFLPLETARLPYIDHDSSAAEDIPVVYLDGSIREFAIPPEHALQPARMQVRERKNVREGLPTRISLLDPNGTTWRTFGLPDEAM